MRSLIKVGQVMAAVTRTVRINGVPFDFSDPKFVAYSKARTQADRTLLWSNRDLTSKQAAYGFPLAGSFATYLFSGVGLAGPSTGSVLVAAGEKVIITAPGSGDATIISQLLLKPKADAFGTYYVAASGPDGFLAGGVPIGDPEYTPAAGVEIVGFSSGTPGADAKLVRPEDTFDESITEGQTVTAPKTSIGSQVAAATITPGAGTITAGNHRFKIVNVRKADAWTNRLIEFEMKIVDTETGRSFIWPTFGTEEIEFTEAIA